MQIVRYWIYPKNLLFVPDRDAADLGLRCLQERPPQRSVLWETYDHPKFLHCGDSFSRVVCPECGEEIDTRDWQDMMDLAYASSHFQVLDIVPMCCGKITALDKLVYESHCAFASCAYSMAPFSAEESHAFDRAEAERCMQAVAELIRRPEGWGLISEER